MANQKVHVLPISYFFIHENHFQKNLAVKMTLKTINLQFLTAALCIILIRDELKRNGNHFYDAVVKIVL